MADQNILARHIAAGDRIIELHGVGPDGTCHCPKAKNCGSAGKHPRGSAWQVSPGLSLTEVEAAMTTRPRANFGLLTGFRFWVLDIDPDNGGDVTLKQLIADHGPLPATYTVQTGSGGWHLYFAMGDLRIPNSAGKVGPGVDVRGAGGQVVAAGSRSAKGEYRSLPECAMVTTIAVAPDWLLDRLGPTTAKRPAAVAGAAQSPRLSAYARSAVKSELTKVSDLERLKWVAPWDATTYGVACNLWELVNALWSGLTEAEASRLFIEACPPAEPGYDPEAKWASAKATMRDKAREAPVPVLDFMDDAETDPNVRKAVALAKVTLADAHAVFQRWLSQDYDTDALDAMLAAVAVETLDGDPIWLLVVSGSGNAKTETVQALDGIAAIITSTISSPGALLSATSAKERAKDATGGLLRKIGHHGVLVIKDVTSILSMNREMRAEVLGALREVYDGRWSRNVGTDGGRTLEWSGRVVVIGAVTTAWDRAHDVIASMGDRFVLLRMDSTKGRQAAGRQAIGNTGSEVRMRTELAAAAGGVIAGMDRTAVTVSKVETDILLAAADTVTLARTGVEYDYRGDVIDAHAPEMPTRFAKQLAQVVRGGVAIGMTRPDALKLALRCARDSMPPLRLAILDDVAANPGSSTADVRKRIGKPRSTVDRQLQALHMLGILEVEEAATIWAGKPATIWQYRIADGIEPHALNPEISTRNVSTPSTPDKNEDRVRPPADKSGTDSVDFESWL